MDSNSCDTRMVFANPVTYPKHLDLMQWFFYHMWEWAVTPFFAQLHVIQWHTTILSTLIPMSDSSAHILGIRMNADLPCAHQQYKRPIY